MSMSQTTKTQAFNPSSKQASPASREPIQTSTQTSIQAAVPSASGNPNKPPIEQEMAALSNTWSQHNAQVELTNRRHDDMARARDAQIRLLLNAMKTVSPQINALIVRPGAGAGEDRQIEALEPMLEATHDLAERMIGVLNEAGIDISDNRSVAWLYRSCMNIAAHEVANQWISDGQVNTSVLEAAARKVADFVRALPKPIAQSLSKDEAYPNLHASESLQLSVFSAMTRVIREIEPYARILTALSMYDSAVERVHQTLSQHAAWYHDQCLDPASSPQARVMLMQAAYRDAGAIYAQCWRVEGRQLADDLAAMPVEQRHAHIRQVGSAAFPVERIDKAFQRSMGRLIAVSKLALQSAIVKVKAEPLAEKPRPQPTTPDTPEAK